MSSRFDTARDEAGSPAIVELARRGGRSGSGARSAAAALFVVGALLASEARPDAVEPPFEMLDGLGGVPIGSAALDGCVLTITSGGGSCPSVSPTSITATLDLRGLRRRPSVLGLFGPQSLVARIIDMPPGDVGDGIRLRYTDEQAVLQHRLASLPLQTKRVWTEEDYEEHGLVGEVPVARRESTYCDGSMSVSELGTSSVIVGVAPGADAALFLNRLEERANAECFVR